MIAGARERWQAVFDHPILRLELRRIRRKRWWPGRRFFLLYPVLLGAVLGCGITLALTNSLEVQLTALAAGVPVFCTLSVVTMLLSFALAWIAPALTATTIARERELGTLDLLRTTLLTERSIVLGKLGGCLARLWPGILALALLSPFQIALLSVSGSLGLSSLAMTGIDSVPRTGLFWVWLLLAGLIGWLRPWSDLALHATVGLFVSALTRSSGTAVAIAYSAILVARVAFYLVSSLANVVLVAVPATLVNTPETMMSVAFAIPTLVSLGTVLVEFVGAALLVWGAVWWMKRM